MYKSLTLPLLVSLFIHGAILAVLLIDMPESERIVKRAATKYIQAELVTLEKPKAKPAPIAKPKPKPKPKPTPKSTLKKAENNAKLAAQKQAVKAEQQRLAQVKSDQLKQQQDKQRKIEEQQRLQDESEREFAEAVAEEQALRLAMDDNELANSYIALISQRIENSWSRPPSARNNMSIVLMIQLAPTGEVVGVNVIKGSGNSAYDRSAEIAVSKVGSFPELKNLPPRIFEQHFRRLQLNFNAEDLRL
ncbi:MAG: colicin import membrane protein [Oceanicoccus sp.]|jgi:colicin import membrane protein